MTDCRMQSSSEGSLVRDIFSKTCVRGCGSGVSEKYPSVVRTTTDGIFLFKGAKSMYGPVIGLFGVLIALASFLSGYLIMKEGEQIPPYQNEIPFSNIIFGTVCLIIAILSFFGIIEWDKVALLRFR